MIISGIQKLTALDFPDRLACTVFSPGCNMRCPFCHNASLVLSPSDGQISEDELFSLLKTRRGILDGVCFTGGEPLLQKGIDGVMRRVKELGFLVKLDTNGTMPDRLAALTEEGLVDFVAMDVKNSPEKYPLTCGLPSFDMGSVTASRDILLSGKTDYEFRTTVVNELHTLDDILGAAKWIEGAKRWFLQCFKDSGDIIGSGLTPPEASLLEEMKRVAVPFVEVVEIRGI